MANTIKLKLGNFVWEDKNGNGRQDADELGMANITVNLRAFDGTSWVTIDSTQTDSKGLYQFTGVGTDDYRVQFIAPTGYMLTSKTGVLTDANNSDANPTSGETDTFTLDVNGASDNFYVDAGLYKTGSISSRVWHDVDGDGIQDATELGLANVTVHLYTETGTTAVQTVSSLADGSYTFNNIAPGKYKLQFVASNGYTYSPQDVSTTTDALDSDADSNGYTGVYTVISDNTLSNVAAGMYQYASIGNRVWLDTNSAKAKDANGVQDAGEAGVAGVVVNAYQAGVLKATTTTAADGSYTLDKLLAGSYEVEFVPGSSYLFTRPNFGDDTLDSDANPNTGRATLNVIAGQNYADLDAGLYPKALSLQLGDQVWLDKDGNGKQNETPLQGVAGVTVKLYDMSNNGSLLAQRVTDNKGNYLFNELLPGDYKVSFSPVTGYSFSLVTQGNNRGLDSDAGSDGNTAVFNLSANNLDIDAGISVQPASVGDLVWYDKNYNGVQDAGETGLAGQKVSLYTSAGKSVKDINGNVVADQTTDADGKYLFSNLVPGDYKVRFTLPANVYFTTKDVTDDAQDSDVSSNGWTDVFNLASGENKTTVDAGMIVPATDKKAIIGDLVWHDVNANGIYELGIDAPIGGVTVKLYNGAGTTLLATTTSDASLGTYYFQGLAAGDYKVQFVSPTFVPYQVKFSPQDQGTNDAIDSDADPTTGFTKTYTLATGDVNVSVDAGFYKPASIGDRLWDDANGNGVQDAGELGIDGVNVYLQRPDGSIVDTQQTKDGGIYHFYNVLPGSYKVKFDTPTGYMVTKQNIGDEAYDSDVDSNGYSDQFTITSNANNDYTILDAGMQKSCSLNGRMWFDDNVDGIQGDLENPVSWVNGASVNLYQCANGVWNYTYKSTAVAADGSYSFDKLPAGLYAIKFVTPSGYGITLKDQGTDDTKDSDASRDTSIIYYTLQAGETANHLDAGITQTATLGGDMWGDHGAGGAGGAGDLDGLHQTNEVNVGNYAVYLQDQAGNISSIRTDANSHYEFAGLAAGWYRVYVPNYSDYNGWVGYYTIHDAGGNVNGYDAIDSDVNWSISAWGQYDNSYAYDKDITVAQRATGIPWDSGSGWMDWTYLDKGEIDFTWDAGITPLILDLNGDGIQTIARTDSQAHFDLLNNGSPIQSGWLSAQDGLLAIDHNHNGKIDNLNELFGGLAKGQGFAKLAEFDSNSDGLVNAQDARFNELLIWQDSNSNHSSEANELLSLSAAGVNSLVTSHVDLPELDAQGNLHLERSTATLSDGTQVAMHDVYFNVAASDAQAAGVSLPSMHELLSDCLDFGPSVSTSHVADDNGTSAKLQSLAHLFDLHGM